MREELRSPILMTDTAPAVRVLFPARYPCGYAQCLWSCVSQLGFTRPELNTWLGTATSNCWYRVSKPAPLQFRWNLQYFACRWLVMAYACLVVALLEPACVLSCHVYYVWTTVLLPFYFVVHLW